MSDHVVRGEQQTPRRVERIGDTVRRPAYPWTPAVHALLRHLESVGFPYSPRVLGFDSEGREVLTYLEGESGPAGWAKVVTDEGLRAAARLLRDYHQAVAGWQRDPDLLWSSGIHEPGDPANPDEAICHGDFGPWNLVWQGDRPVGILDWDFAYPAPPRRDVVYALEYLVPFRGDAECVESLHHPVPPDRRRRLEVFAEAYGLTSSEGLVEDVIRTQRETLETVRRLADAGCEPQASWVAQGYLDVLQHRIRWSEDYRWLFDT
ncbi:aminoglycoside phosphotransferase family protein [Actinopolymorpha alba]|uniref:aminoglycoside phosphotransferase family protein n=1 Tax=Actinopolymorpha alba TaxID=533267 RepID=UPI00039C2530|nr:aminoglycoside phosphotransferase family protein [Actinopolymorpha alba]